MPDQAQSLKSDLIQQCPLAGILAGRLRAESDDLTRRWLDRINARVEVSENRIFPSNDLLNHIPLLIIGVADTLGRAFLPSLLRGVFERSVAQAAGPALASMLIYLLMAAVLALRPQGLFPVKHG